jgi:hypothetical protein
MSILGWKGTASSRPGDCSACAATSSSASLALPDDSMGRHGQDKMPKIGCSSGAGECGEGMRWIGRWEVEAGGVVCSPCLKVASKLDFGKAGLKQVRQGRGDSQGRVPWEGSLDSPRQLQATNLGRWQWAVGDDSEAK